MSGLLTAAALSPCFRRVIVLERGEFATEGKVRQHVPQGGHVHGLLCKGWQAMDRMLPGLKAEMDAAGATWVDFSQEFKWYHFGHVKSSFERPMVGPFISRPVLENLVYAQVELLGNIEMRSGVAVKSLTGDADCVTGIEYEGGGFISADLVIDASGRASKTPRWLEQLGAKVPREETIPANVNYTTRRFSRPEEMPDWKGLFVIPKPPETRAGAIFPVEGGDWMVTVGARDKSAMPKTNDDFIEFAKTLHTPELAEWLEKAEPKTDICHFSYPKSQRRYYHESGTPEGFLVMGDAMCSFNPLFGQGITICAMEAELLGCLLQSNSDWQREFYEQANEMIDVAWEMVELEDLRYPDVRHLASWKVKLRQAITARLHYKTSVDPELNQCFKEIIHFLRPPKDMMSLKMLMRLF